MQTPRMVIKVNKDGGIEKKKKKKREGGGCGRGGTSNSQPSFL